MSLYPPLRVVIPMLTALVCSLYAIVPKSLKMSDPQPIVVTAPLPVAPIEQAPPPHVPYPLSPPIVMLEREKTVPALSKMALKKTHIVSKTE